MSARERILGRLRAALGASSAATRGADVAAHLTARGVSPRPRVPGDLEALFRTRAAALSTTISAVTGMSDVPAAVGAYLRSQLLPLQAVCWPALGTFDWPGQGLQVETRPARESDKVGITETFCAIAETGTLMTLSGAQTPPATSLLPETHIAVLRVSQIVPAMEEAWQRLRNACAQKHDNFMPRAVNFISGPSRTADIEQTLVVGAHGPYRVHIVLVAID